MLKRKIKVFNKVISAWKIIFTYYGYNLFRSAHFFKLYLKCIKHTHASVPDLLDLYSFVEIIKKDKIEGDIVEYGSWKGGTSAIVFTEKTINL